MKYLLGLQFWRLFNHTELNDVVSQNNNLFIDIYKLVTLMMINYSRQDLYIRRHGCSPVNLLHISQHLFLRTTLEGYFCSQFYIALPRWILNDFYMLSQILRDGINFWVIFKETTCISKYQLDLSLLQALQQHVFLRMISLTCF